MQSKRAPRRPPLVRQMNQTDCGLCCCAILLRSWRSSVSIRDLRQDYVVGRDGLNIADIVKILTDRGAAAHVYETNAVGVLQLREPAICYWNDNHYIVARQITKKRVSIVDPGAGRSTVSLEEFTEHFSGYAITIDPFPARQQAASPSSFQVLRSLARNHIWLLALTVIVALGSALATLWLPSLLGIVFSWSPAASAGSFWPVLMILGIALGQAFLLISRSLMSLAAATSVGKSMSEAVFSRMMRLPYGDLMHRGVGDLLFTLDSVQRLRSLITTDFVVVIVGAVMITTLMVWLMLQSWIAGLVAVGLVGILALLAVFSGRGIRRISLEETRRRAELQSLQVTALSGLEAIKTNAMEDTYIHRWRLINNAVQRQSVGLQSIQSVFTALSASLQLVGPILIVLVVTLGLSRQPDPALIVSVQALSGFLLGQVAQVTGSFSQVAQGWTLLERVADILVRSEDGTFKGTSAPPAVSAIEVKDVCFSYGSFSRPVLSNVSIDVPPGAKVALVGASGSGKSTLGRLIVGLHTPTSGKIRVGGREFGEYSRTAFYDDVAYVPQNVILDTGSLRDNIAWGTGDIRDADIRYALERVGLANDIAELPLGLDTPVAQLGQNFSGGQRQRIALARAALKNAKIVVLDEATSSLDNTAETTVSDYFNQLAATRIIIAHRLSTVIDADIIFVMQEGQIVEQGTHSELITRPGIYRRLYLGEDAGGSSARDSHAFNAISAPT
ncbi:peptidase domain-containing ABC transporter [Microbacterium lacticum]